MHLGIMHLCVYDDKVEKIPQSWIAKGKIIKPELSESTILMAEFIYSVNDRKPNDLLRIVYERISFNQDGIYQIDLNSDEFRVKMEYIWGEDKLPIPIAPIEPTTNELDLLKQYVRSNYPNLLKRDPNVIESYIYMDRERHREDILLMKKSHKTDKGNDVDD